MLARVASNLFWLNRYLHRVENTARLIRVHANLLMDLPGADPAVSWLPLVSIAGGDEEFSKLGLASDEVSVCEFLISNTKNPGSLANNLQAISVNLRSSRDCMSTDLYELVKTLCSYSTILAEQCRSTNSRQNLLKKLEYQSLAISGAITSTISRDTGYLFLHAGGLIERADMTSRILDVRSANLLPMDDATTELLPFENLQWVSVLRTLSAFQMYMKHVKKPVIGSDVLSFLLQNRQFPQAIHYCLTELAQCIRLIGPGQLRPGQSQQGQSQQGQQQGQLQEGQGAVKAESNRIPQLDELINNIQQADIALLAKNKQQLHEFIDQLQIALININGEIAARYFPPNDL